MILMIQENGSAIPFLQYQFAKNDLLALYGEGINFLIQEENIEQKLSAGKCYTGELPALYLYNEEHGPLTDESLQKFGVSVSILIFVSQSDKKDIQELTGLYLDSHEWTENEEIILGRLGMPLKAYYQQRKYLLRKEKISQEEFEEEFPTKYKWEDTFWMIDFVSKNNNLKLSDAEKKYCELYIWCRTISIYEDP